MSLDVARLQLTRRAALGGASLDAGVLGMTVFFSLKIALLTGGTGIGPHVVRLWSSRYTVVRDTRNSSARSA